MGLRELKAHWRTFRAVREIERRKIDPRPHGLDCPLTVSLTSYPARYGTLAITLKAILRQTIRADRTVLWLAHGDDALLPPEVLALRAEGLMIRTTDDIRSYKKIIPTLREWPDSAVVTADDDVYYPPHWLEVLVARRVSGGGDVLCHRAHRVMLDGTGKMPLPYSEWKWGIRKPDHSGRVFPTGVLGVFYAPGSFHEDVGRAEIFTELCPSADDVWLYWMHRMTGAMAEKVGPKWRVLEWPSSQETNLRTENLGQDGNDAAIAAMIARYGFPDPSSRGSRKH